MNIKNNRPPFAGRFIDRREYDTRMYYVGIGGYYEEKDQNFNSYDFMYMLTHDNRMRQLRRTGSGRTDRR